MDSVFYHQPYVITTTLPVAPLQLYKMIVESRLLLNRNLSETSSNGHGSRVCCFALSKVRIYRRHFFGGDIPAQRVNRR